MKRTSYYLFAFMTVATLVTPAVFAPVTPTLAAPGKIKLDSGLIAGDCSNGNCSAPTTPGTTARVGKTSGGVRVPDHVYIPGINPVIIESLRAPNVSTALSAAGQLVQSKFVWAQSFVLEALKKRVLDLMVDEIIFWIQGKGDPKFITNWEDFLSAAAGTAASDFSQRIGLADLCAPLKQQMQQRFGSSNSGGLGGSGSVSGSRKSSLSCTLDKIVGNIDDFYNDFSNGGWAAYQEAWAPQNNIFGAYVLAESSRVSAIAAAQDAALYEGLASGGLLSSRSCAESPNDNGPDLDRDGIKGDISSTCKITTPGSVVAALVNKAVGSDIDFVVNSQQLASYVAAISDALFNRLIREGVGGLKEVSTNHSPNDDGFLPEGANNDCELLGSVELINACEDYESSNNGNFEITRSNILADIAFVRSQLLELRPAIVEWQEVAVELNAFIIAQSVDRSAECINEALASHFTNATAAGVAALAASADAQLQIIDTRIALLDAYTLELTNLATTSWSEFTTLASMIQSQLIILQIPEEATEQVLTQKEELRSAFELDIRPDVLLCN